MNSHGNDPQEFLLKWNDHHNSFFSIMQDLCANEMLTDVTLACGGEVFETHKLMLCVCSTFFRSILTRRSDRQPIVFLKDVNPRHMELLLQYMYNGEINVLQEDLNPLIETARSLQIKGLSDAPAETKQPAKQLPSGPPPLKKARPLNPLLTQTLQSEPKPSPLTTSHLANRLTQPPRSVPTKTTHDSWSGSAIESQTDNDTEEVEQQFKSEPFKALSDTDNQGDDYESEQGFEADGFVDSGVFGGKPMFELKTQNQAGGGGPVRRHMCLQCGKGFVTPSKLQRHVFSHSGIRPFHCVLCGRHFSQAANLKTHIRNTHAEADAAKLVAAATLAQAAPDHATDYSSGQNPNEDDLSSDVQ